MGDAALAVAAGVEPQPLSRRMHWYLVAELQVVPGHHPETQPGGPLAQVPPLVVSLVVRDRIPKSTGSHHIP